ncbi:MAG: hypothetical protein IT204_16045 [Fimbriimonadaceae bacterium]|nr:hypothetical protein [Fimbriimonadaceae bacterium]
MAICGAGSAGRTTAAAALHLLGYEAVSFANRLRHLIAMSAGLPEAKMLESPDEPFGREFVLQSFHIDGMCRLAASWATIPDDAPKKMREKAARNPLRTPREVMRYVRTELFENCVAPTFWVDLFKAHYQPDRESNLCIDDTTSVEEGKFVHSLGGLLVGIDRPGLTADLTACDLVIVNDGSLEQLQDQVVAEVFGRLRGAPMRLAGGAAAPLPAPSYNGDSDVPPGADVEAATAHLQREIDVRDDTIAKLVSERDALAGSLREAQQNLDQASTRPAAAAPPAPTGPTPAAEADTAALAARLALALGLEAGIGKDPSGQPMLCIDLPAGRVSWPVAEGSYPLLPRYDKAPAPADPLERRDVLLDPQVKVNVSTDQALQREGSELAVVAGVLKDLILLAEGCKIHRAYRAKQAPKGDCPTCWSMWRASERVTGLSRVYQHDEV